VGKWHHAQPWSDSLAAVSHDVRPRWPSAGAALLAYCEGMAHGHELPSAHGIMIDRLERGETSGGSMPEREGPMQRRAGELLAVQRALEVAYPEGAHPHLSAHDCRWLLLWRTPGVVAVGDARKAEIKASHPLPMPTYEELALMHGVTVGDVRALVRTGRERVTEELVRRGVIPRPRGDGRKKGGSACQMTAERN
jgi:hypothetical protein